MHAFENTTSYLLPLPKSSLTSQQVNSISLCCDFAFAIISCELSMPTILAFGNLFCNTSVLFPGPQPISIMFLGFSMLIDAARSIDGRFLCFLNFKYCSEFQLNTISPLTDRFCLMLILSQINLQYKLF